MKQSMKWFAAAIVGTAFLAGCTSTTSRGVNDQGQAQEVIFPKITKSEAIREGIFPNIENLRKIAPGVTKDDLYYLIGRPHFSEMHGAREWDYIMKFRQPDSSVVVCQYKAIFDKHMKAQSFYWLPANCADYVNAPAPVAAPVVSRSISLNADALFAFNRSDLNNMLPKGRAELDALAGDLLPIATRSNIRITGFTDRLGSEAYNQSLSEKRAETVRRYLINKGLPEASISARGLGEANPVVECNQSNRNALIQCLQPNRRVVVDVMSQ